jgi:hypothetical protein
LELFASTVRINLQTIYLDSPPGLFNFWERPEDRHPADLLAFAAMFFWTLGCTNKIHICSRCRFGSSPFGLEPITHKPDPRLFSQASLRTRGSHSRSYSARCCKDLGASHRVFYIPVQNNAFALDSGMTVTPHIASCLKVPADARNSSIAVVGSDYCRRARVAHGWRPRGARCGL